MTPTTSDLLAVRESVQRLIAPFNPEYWRTVDKNRTFPDAFFDRVAEAGYFGTLIPTEYGGSDAGPAVASVLLEEINRAGGDSAAINAQMAICNTLVRDGSAEQKQRYLPGIASGEIRCICVAATEPDSGADMTQLVSSARRDGEGWVINAQKVFISFAEHSRLFFLLTNSVEGAVLFLLDREEMGDAVQLTPLETITNRLTTTLFIDELWVPDSSRVGAVGRGGACLAKGFAPRRIFAASEALGNARFLLGLGLEYARTRKVSSRLIGENQGVQYPLTQAYLRVEAAELMRDEALRQLLAGEKTAEGRSAMAKILASEAAWEAARATMTAFGGWSLSSEMHIERKLRECTVFVFNNLLTNYVAHKVLNLPVRED